MTVKLSYRYDCIVCIYFYLRRRLASGESIVTLGVRLCVCVCVFAEPRLHGGEGNALYPVFSS